MLSKKTQELAEAIKRLKAAAQHAFELSQGLPAAEKNAYMILRQIEMLEIEICDPVDVLAESDRNREE
ncbi:MAG: hypothetical protein ACE5JU_08390 [Candidatus Binatia bacterium]